MTRIQEERRLRRLSEAKEQRREAIRQGWPKRKTTNAEIIARYKTEHPCVICGEDHPACLDFHHRDPAKKSYGIAAMGGVHYTEAALYLELAKCVILCANCHRLFHAGFLALPPEE